jgi:hypothetical protein
MNIKLAMIEPTDDEVLEHLAKKTIHHGEEALMLAVLKSATEDFSEICQCTRPQGKTIIQ